MFIAYMCTFKHLAHFQCIGMQFCLFDYDLYICIINWNLLLCHKFQLRGVLAIVIENNRD